MFILFISLIHLIFIARNARSDAIVRNGELAKSISRLIDQSKERFRAALVIRPRSAFCLFALGNLFATVGNLWSQAVLNSEDSTDFVQVHSPSNRTGLTIRASKSHQIVAQTLPNAMKQDIIAQKKREDTDNKFKRVCLIQAQQNLQTSCELLKEASQIDGKQKEKAETNYGIAICKLARIVSKIKNNRSSIKTNNEQAQSLEAKSRLIIIIIILKLSL